MIELGCILILWLIVNLISKGCVGTHPCYALVLAIHNICKDEGSVTWMHVLHESNQMADAMAKHAISMNNQYNQGFQICKLMGVIRLCVSTPDKVQ